MKRLIKFSQEFKDKITLNRPLQVGCSILELSKLVMYKYYFDVLKVKFGERLSPLYSDTDSFILQLRTRNFPKDLRRIRKTMDFSNFDPADPLYSTKNAARLGFFKSEVASKRIHVMSSLRSKV